MSILIALAISAATFVYALIAMQVEQSLEVARLATLRAETAELELEMCKRELAALRKEIAR